MTVQIIVDSAADITLQETQKWDLRLLPMTITFGEDVYKDKIDLDHEEFFDMLAKSQELPRTSQISPGEFSAAFQQIVDNGDTAVVILISGNLSGTYQSAMLAAQEYPNKIFVVDSMNATAGERLLVKYAMRLRDQNMAAADIAAELDKAKKNIRVIALVDTLEYLHKGGRISRTVAFTGNVLSIKPVLALENGEIFMKGKARGSKKGYKVLRKLIDQSNGINFDMPFSAFYSGISDEGLQKYIADTQDIWNNCTAPLSICSIGATIGTHVGPGAIGVAFFEKE